MTLHAESYTVFCKKLAASVNEESKVDAVRSGRLLKFPSFYAVGNGHMRQKELKIIGILKNVDYKHKLFTMTYSSQCPEIIYVLFSGQSVANIPDIAVPVFGIKICAFMAFVIN